LIKREKEDSEGEKQVSKCEGVRIEGEDQDTGKRKEESNDEKR
jgi:hypothetical protein